MSVALRDGGAFRTATQAAYRDAGAWRTLREIHYRDAGAWRKVFGSLALALTSQTIAAYDIIPYTPIARLQFSNTGAVRVDAGSSRSATAYVDVIGEWCANGVITAAQAADFECRADVLGGTAPAGSVAQWLPLGTTRTWTLSAPPQANNNYRYLFCQLQVQVREIANPSNSATTVYYLSAELDTGN